MKTIKHWRKKLKTLDNGKTPPIQELIESMLWKWLHNWKQSIDTKFHKNSNVIFQKNRKKNPKIYLEAQKTQKKQINPEQKEQC
jgi:hypothetical protein